MDEAVPLGALVDIVAGAAEAGRAEQRAIVNRIARIIRIEAEETDQETLADEHSLNQQRYFNMVCWVYGSNPDDNEDLLEDWELPEARAEQCPDEYALINRSWSSLLAEHLR